MLTLTANVLLECLVKISLAKEMGGGPERELGRKKEYSIRIVFR